MHGIQWYSMVFHLIEGWCLVFYVVVQGVFLTGTPPKSTKKLIKARLGVPWPIYVNVDTPNLGFPYFNFLGGYQLKKHPVSDTLVTGVGHRLAEP